ncbi:hypothetical protein [Streptomyces vastus]|uniref:Uncharacterized protein n=1 Tax=Streptomyces vastus TaxID=285451 RepID=A0ABN3QS71_9ACTN
MAAEERREVILRIGPGETVEEFTRRVVGTSPSPSPEVMVRLRILLVQARGQTSAIPLAHTLFGGGTRTTPAPRVRA